MMQLTRYIYGLVDSKNLIDWQSFLYLQLQFQQLPNILYALLILNIKLPENTQFYQIRTHHVRRVDLGFIRPYSNYLTGKRKNLFMSQIISFYFCHLFDSLINTDNFKRNTIIFLFNLPKTKMTMLVKQYDFVFKILLIGNSSVGKSSLLLRFADDKFNETFLPTIGVDFKIRTIQHEGSIVKLQMWDTAGQQKFKTITSAYYKGAQGIILVFDLTDKRSFNDIKNWIAESQKNGNRDSVKILVGNKSDLHSERQVSREEAERFAENQGMKYYQASAKTKKNVETIFQALTSEMKGKYTQSYIQKNKKPTTTTLLLPLNSPIEKVVKKTTCC